MIITEICKIPVQKKELPISPLIDLWNSSFFNHSKAEYLAVMKRKQRLSWILQKCK